MLMLAVAPDATITTPVSPVLMYDEDTSIRDKVMLESDTCTPPMKGILMDFWILGSWRGVMEERASSIRRSFTKTRPFSEMIAEMKPEPSDRIWGAAGIVVRRERRRKRRSRGGAMVLMFGGEEEGGRKKKKGCLGPVRPDRVCNFICRDFRFRVASLMEKQLRTSCRFVGPLAHQGELFMYKRQRKIIKRVITLRQEMIVDPTS